MTKTESQEAVLVVPRDIIATVAPKVFNHEVESAKTAALGNCRFLERDLAEEDENFKQVIP